MKIVNRRSIMLICAFAASVLLYIFADAGYAALLAVIFLLLFIFAGLSILISGRSVDIDISCPAQAVKGENTKGIISLKKNGRMPVLCCNLSVRNTNLLTDQVENKIHSFSLFNRKEKNIETGYIPSYCGCIRLDAYDITVSDPLKIFTRKMSDVRYISGNSGHTYCMPSVSEAFVSQSEINIYDMESYKYSSTLKGNDPSETFDLKTYENGDSFKSIHWKLSSKTGELTVREFGLPVENNLLLLVDKNMGGLAPEKADRIANYVASLSSALINSEVNHTIGWYDFIDKKFEFAEVYGMESMWNAVMKFISSPFRKDEMSSIDRYIGSENEKQFSAYIYVSENTDDIDRLMTYGQVEIFNPENQKG